MSKTSGTRTSGGPATAGRPAPRHPGGRNSGPGTTGGNGGGRGSGNGAGKRGGQGGAAARDGRRAVRQAARAAARTQNAGGSSRLRRSAWWLGPALVLALVGVLAILSSHHSGQGTSASGSSSGLTASQRAQLAALARRQPGDPTAMGSVSAPVVIIIWSDYQCPYCGQFARTTEQEIIKNYVDSGLVRLEWRDLPYLGPQSTPAAYAARAAGDQGKFWQFHDALYANQHPVNSGQLNDAALRTIAGRLGLNMARWDTDRNSTATRDEVQADTSEATSLGIDSTPAFIVGGTPVMGAQPYSVFKQLIDSALAAAKK